MSYAFLVSVLRLELDKLTRWLSWRYADTFPTGVSRSVTVPDSWHGAVVNISLSDEFHLTAVTEYTVN